MRILHVTPYYAPAWQYGGPVRAVFEITRGLVKRGHEVSVITSDALGPRSRVADRRSNEEGVEIHRLPNVSNRAAWRARLFLPRSGLGHLADEVSRSDVIHIHDVRTIPNIVAFRMARKKGVPVVLQPHGSAPRLGKVLLKRIFDKLGGHGLLSGASAYIAVSQQEAKQFDGLGVDPARVFTIPLGIEPPDFFAHDAGASDRPAFLFLGRLNAIKGIDTLLLAFRQVVDVHSTSMLTLVGPDDGEGGRLRALAQSLGIAERVRFVGPLDGNEKFQSLASADVVIQPSRYEILGLVPLEAIAVGVPVIASDEVGVGDYLSESDGYFRFKSGDPQSLAASMLSVVNDGASARSAARAGRRRIITEFSWSTVSSRVEHVYESVRSIRS